MPHLLVGFFPGLPQVSELLTLPGGEEAGWADLTPDQGQGHTLPFVSSFGMYARPLLDRPCSNSAPRQPIGGTQHPLQRFARPPQPPAFAMWRLDFSESKTGSRMFPAGNRSGRNGKLGALHSWRAAHLRGPARRFGFRAATGPLCLAQAQRASPVTKRTQKKRTADEIGVAL